MPDDLQWLVQLMTLSRQAIREYASGLNGRLDDIDHQLYLSRIAQAVRWALRFEGTPKASLALNYAGRYSALYYERFPEEAARLQLQSFDVPRKSEEELETTAADDAIWAALWNAADHFGRKDRIYLLVAESLPREAELESIGTIPWSAVVDLDPRSHEDGLYSRAGMVLEAERAVHVFSDASPLADYKRGTAWLMNAGWRLRHEAPTNFRTWLRTRFRHVRDLFARLRYSAGPQPAVLVVLLNAHAETDAAAEVDRAVRVIEAFDEEWGDNGQVFVVGETDLSTICPHEYFPMSASAFASNVARTLGTAEHDAAEFVLPSQEGTPTVVPRETMNAISEYFDVLHSQIHLTHNDESTTNDAFWRGGRILWSDLAADLDVPRTIGSLLRERVEASLSGHRTQTVVLDHRPGAGGTTAGLRCAWDLHWHYAVAVLPPGRAMTAERVSLMADRLQRLFSLTDAPVLFVAEAADLPESLQDALHRELALRHTRVTTLFIRRSFAPTANLSVSSPLDAEEAQQFLSQYRERTSDTSRINELELLSSDAYAAYRTPFFYGLIAYQRDFEKLGDFVDHHLREVAGRARDVLSHLALVSLYSSSGLQFAQLLRLLRLDTNNHQLTIEDLLGSASALVVQRAGRYRIAHQLLADEILERLVSSEWRLHLSDLAFDFVDDIVGAADDEPTRLLLRQVFIDRMAGALDGTEDREQFSPLVEDLDAIDPLVGHRVLKQVADQIGDEPHFWNHLGRHQIYRLRKDLDLAETYLDRAVSISPDDALHHHTLGLARRARLRQGLRSSERQGAEAVMQVIESLFERTVSCFQIARELSPDDIYGYITHVQTIVEAARALRNAAKVNSVSDLTSFSDDWMTEQLTIANGLLDDAVQLYGSLDRQDDYLEKCLADIKKLYGDLDGVVRVWELNNARGQSSPFGRRALVHAYFIRGGRSWRGLTDDELRRAAGLAEQNLRMTGAREEDYRLWFEASKLLPDFDLLHAAGQLELWSARLPSWRATYYRYVLAFLMWWTERSDDITAIHRAQEECAAKAPGRQGHSYVWLSTDPSWCPLIADSDLGTWDKRERFWADPDALIRVNGTIDVIYGPTQGSVIVGDPRLRAFFVPAAGGFLMQADENQKVNFYIGFSPSGLRAWDVRRGHDTSATRRRVPDTATTPEVTRPRHAAFEKIQKQRAAALERTRVKSAVLGLLATATARGNETTLAWLEERIYAMFGLARDGQHVIAVRSIVDSLPDVTVREVGGDILIRTRTVAAEQVEDIHDERVPGHVLNANDNERWGLILGSAGRHYRFDYGDITPTRPEIKRGRVVSFVPSIERRGDRAIQIELETDDASLYKGRIIPASELREMVVGETRDFLESVLAEGRHTACAVSDLEEHLQRAFIGATPLFRRLGSSAMRQFLHGLDWLTITGKSGQQVVTINQQAFFSRPSTTPDTRHPDTVALTKHSTNPTSTEQIAPQQTIAPAAKSPSPRTGDTTRSTAALHDRFTLAGVVAALRWAGTPPALQQVGSELRTRLGEERYASFCGSSRLRARIAADGMWTLQEEKPGVVVIRANLADPTEELLLTLHQLLQRSGSPVTLTRLGAALQIAVGPERYAELKGASLTVTINGITGWSLEDVDGGHPIVHPPKPLG